MQESAQHEEPAHEAVAAVFKRSKQSILRLWEKRVRQELPAASAQEEAALFNSLPALLDQIADVLDSPSPDEALRQQESQMALDHGRERALLADYTLGQVIAEYHALRHAIFDVLENTTSLAPTTRDVILDAIHIATRNAASAYARSHDEEQARMHAQLAEAHHALEQRVRRHTTELEAREALFRHLVEGVKDYAILTVDPNGFITTWNDGAERMKQYTPEEAVGQHVEILYPEASRRRNEPMLHLHAAATEGRFRAEGLRQRKDGELFLADVLITPMYAGGRLSGFSEVVQDLTERHQLIQERGLTRGEQNDLEAKRQQREHFVSTLTPDLRGPLVAALASLKMITRHAAGSERVIDWAMRATRSVQRVDRMIADLLDVNRLRAGETMSLGFRACDLARAAHEVVDELTMVYGNRFTLQTAGDLKGVWDDASLRRVLENLLVNAIKYGDGTPIAMRLERREQHVLLTVHNQGQPIDVEEVPFLFEPFHRGRAVQPQQKGWGLGLALVRSIVEAHNGKVNVESSPAQGTTFTIDLPIDSRRGG